VVVVCLMQGCGFRVHSGVTPSVPSTAAPAAAGATATALSGASAGSGYTSPTDSATLAPTSLPLSVRVTAVRGNVFIRRGPDVAFNAVSVLRDGQTTNATARDVLSQWLQIPLPDNPGTSGWISILTEFTVVTGNPDMLPEVQPSVWPELAFVRNCTHHQMAIDPAGLIIPPVEYFPDNDLRVNPGEYTVRDLDVDEYPQVLKISIHEGSEIDILVDGNGEKKKCPLP
jgi:hypothetical protein